MKNVVNGCDLNNVSCVGDVRWKMVDGTVALYHSIALEYARYVRIDGRYI